MKPLSILFFFFFNLFCNAQQIIGKLVRLNEEINLIIAESAVIEIFADGFNWSVVHWKVLVLSPSGKHLGTFLTEERTASCALNKDELVLYMTSDVASH